MDELNKIGRKPDFKGEGIAVWLNRDKNGRPFLSVVVLGNIRLNAFRNEPKQQPKPVTVEELGNPMENNDLNGF